MKLCCKQKITLSWLKTFLSLVIGTTICCSSAQGGVLSGFVKDRAGAPVVAGDLDFDLVFSGLRIVTPGDNTDISGFYSVLVAPNIYHVSFAPPLNSHLVGKRFFNLDLRTSIALDVVLDSGIVITGIVTDSLGSPIPGVVNIDVDSLGAGRVYTPAGKTDSITGAFWIVVPAYDKYRLRFKPPPGMNLQVGQVDSLSIQSDTTINMILVPGVSLSGSVTNSSGAAVPLTKLSLKRTSDGVKIPLANNKSDSLGQFQVIAPAGQYALQFAPPIGMPLVGVEFDSVTLITDTIVDVTLTAGVMVSATITDIDGAPLRNADIDVIRESDLVRLYTPHDKTDANGFATVVVVPDTYEFKADPPVGVILDKSVLRNIIVTLDTALTFVLKPLNRVNVTGRITDKQGVGIAGVAIGALRLPGRIPATVKQPLSNSFGYFDAAVPNGTIDILFSPPRGSRFTGKRIANVTLAQDSTLGIIQLDTGIVITAHVVNPQGAPATGYDLGLLSSGVELFTPHDTVNVFGELVVTAPPGVYDISVVPPAGTVGDSLSISGVSFMKDTVLTLVLGGDQAPNPATFVLRQNYPNPFNGVTRMPYLLNVQSNLTMSIHNVLGQEVRRFEFGIQTPGYYTPIWDGADKNGSPVASGVYFYRLHASQTEITRKMLFIQ
jgi:FlgD Ig-like domain